MERVRETEPQLFRDNGDFEYEAARSFRRWARYFDEVSPQILSRFGVSAFTALHRVAPQYFGWHYGQLKPWELEQEHGKWKGPRGRALLRSAYAFALYEHGLGSISYQEDQVLWQCTLPQFSHWAARLLSQDDVTPYEFLYGLASRHGLTPLLNREISHTQAISLLAGMNLHEKLPRIEGCWELCMRMAFERHGGEFEVRLDLPDLVPLPLRLRKAALAPLSYAYLHKELRLVRDFDLRMARESRRKLEEIPGWWDDERIAGTPLLDRLTPQGTDADPARHVLEQLRPEPCFEATMGHTNIMHVSFDAISRGFERILARDDTREMLDSLLLHIGTAYETEIWGQVRKLIVLDVINDLLALTIKNSLLHLMSSD